jgi:hypothetical protein
MLTMVIRYIIDLLRNNLEKPGERISIKRSNMHGNNLEKPGERISIKRSNMHGAMDALEGGIL